MNVKAKIQWFIIEKALSTGFMFVPGFDRIFKIERLKECAVKWTDEHGRSVITYCADKGQLKMHYAFIITLVQKLGPCILRPEKPNILSTTDSMGDARKAFPKLA